MKTFRVHKAYRTVYLNPLSLVKGQTVVTGQEETEEKWKGWIWADSGTAQEWVPLQILSRNEINKNAIVLEDYTARELDTDPGDEVEIIRSLNGWSWVKKLPTGEEGWIPDEILAE